MGHVGHFTGREVEDFGNSKIRDFGFQGGGEEHIVGGEVSVHNGGRQLMKVAQAKGYIGQDVVVSGGIWYPVVLQMCRKSGVQ